MEILKLTVLPDKLTVTRLDPSQDPPSPPPPPGFWSLTRTGEETSLVCREEESPPSAKKERGWRAIKVRGPLDFEMTGVLSSLADPLAKAGISVFVISTYDTDYLLVKGRDLKTAREALREKGHIFE